MISSFGFRVWWILLLGCILFGLYGAATLSFATARGINPCPEVWITRACYVVFAAYLAMGAAQFIGRRRLSRILFWGGWLIAFGFAAFGSSGEIIQGDVCPIVQTGGLIIPMCYISLALCVAILSLYLIIQQKHRSHSR